VCTLTLAWRVFPDAPVIAAATRDEAYDRPSEPPTVHPDGVAPDRGPGGSSTPGDGSRSAGDAPAVLAPTDARAGGTWIGLNDRGVLLAVTNRWTDADPAGDRSRGLLAADGLTAASAAGAARLLERGLQERSYAGCNLVVADPDAAHLLEWDGRLSRRPLEPGIHVVVNVGADGAFAVPETRADAGERQARAARRLRGELQPEPGEAADDWLDRAGATIADHEFGVCVHGDGFGTRSASLVRVRTDGDVRWEYAPGPPCETPYEPVGAGFGVDPRHGRSG